MNQDDSFRLLISRPKSSISSLVQGIWAASVLDGVGIEKTLYADACSGIIFNLAGNVAIGENFFPEGIVALPVKSRADNMVLFEGARVAGIRFHPGGGFAFTGKHFDRPTLLSHRDSKEYRVHQLYSKLKRIDNLENSIQYISDWAVGRLANVAPLPKSLDRALKSISLFGDLSDLNACVDISHRQVERLFKAWVAVTPKQYQRILRVKRTIHFLRLNENVKLSDVAQHFGYSDQAHMNREFREIASTTPRHL